MRSIQYVIPGNPIQMTRTHHHEKRRQWNEDKNNRCKYKMALINQHGDRPPFSGPIHLDINFYLEAKHDSKVTQPHDTNPRLSRLVDFVEEMGNRLLFGNSCLIASTSVHKFYDTNPRTELIITELRCQKK